MYPEQAVAASTPSKPDRIIGAAVGVLRDAGYHGMSMRAVAGAAGVSLSNVQYYYRDKDTLVCAVVEHYMALCETQLRGMVERLGELPLAERRSELLADALKHGHELSEMCLVFREIWALSSRNEKVAAVVRRYYAAYAELLSDCLLPGDAPAQRRRQLSLLLVPYIEGYSIAGSGLREDTEDAHALMTQLLAALERG